VRSLAQNLAVALLILSSLICTTQTGEVQSPIRSHVPFPMPGPMAQVARDYAWRPARVDVHAQSVKVGERVPATVVLLDASGKLTYALERMSFSLQAISPSGKVVVQNLEAAPGASSVDLFLPATEPGLTKLIVRQSEDHLLESSNFVLITAQTPLSAPQLMLRVSGESNVNVRADQINYARIAVYYMDSRPKRSPIEVWLTWNHGDVKPNPLIIKKEEHFAEAHWTSNLPMQGATVTVAEVKPAVPLSGARSATINFVEPLSGIAFSNLPNTISIVDDFPLHARFYDLDGNYVSTSGKRDVDVSSSTGIVHLRPSAGETHGDFQTELIPAGWGSTEIEVWTPGYPPFAQTVVITYLAVLWISVAGGLLGALADLLPNRNRSRSWHILLSVIMGVVTALLCSWVYIVSALPLLPAGVLHSRIVVLCVSLVGGWTGKFTYRKIAAAVGSRVEHFRP